MITVPLCTLVQLAPLLIETSIARVLSPLSTLTGEVEMATMFCGSVAVDTDVPATMSES